MLRYRSDNNWSCPMVIRVPIGGYLRGGAPYHSQSGVSIFAHCPGLRIVFPSNAVDAAGLLRTAIRCDDPVLFLEHKHLYRQTYNKGVYPGPDYMIPFGKAAVRRDGTDMTVHHLGRAGAALAARGAAGREGRHQRRGHRPAHDHAVRLGRRSPQSVQRDQPRRSSRTRITLTCGFGAEIAARIGDELFEYLDAPVTRVAALDTPGRLRARISRRRSCRRPSDVLAAIKALARLLIVVLRVVAVALGLALPLTVQPAAPRVDDDAARRLFARADVVAAVDALKAREPAILDDQVALSEIPAPPFKEARARRGAPPTLRRRRPQRRAHRCGSATCSACGAGGRRGRTSSSARTSTPCSPRAPTSRVDARRHRAERAGHRRRLPRAGGAARRSSATMDAVVDPDRRHDDVRRHRRRGRPRRSPRRASTCSTTELAGTIDALRLDRRHRPRTSPTSASAAAATGSPSRGRAATATAPSALPTRSTRSAAPWPRSSRLRRCRVAEARRSTSAASAAARRSTPSRSRPGSRSTCAPPTRAALPSLDARFQAPWTTRWRPRTRAGTSRARSRATLTVVGDRPAGSTADTAPIVRAARERHRRARRARCARRGLDRRQRRDDLRHPGDHHRRRRPRVRRARARRARSTAPTRGRARSAPSC